MDRLRTSTKRAHSPVPLSPLSPSSPTVPQMDGASLAKTGKLESEPPTPRPPEMPSFLNLTDEQIKKKYAELQRLEMERLVKGISGQDEQWAFLAPNQNLDRYNNIYPWAKNRVHLKVPKGYNDYINASPINLVSSSAKKNPPESDTQYKYVCMQGPKKQTVNHVWHMIWNEFSAPSTSSPAVIIMLTATHVPNPEDPSKILEKCYPYFPKDDKSEPIQINQTNELGEEFKGTLKFVSREPDIPGTTIEVRKFVMTVEGKEEAKPVIHYLYQDWPDYGSLAEENIASILKLMDISRKENGEGENARLVHCSAGVGRTGTFIALEFLIGELNGGAWENWDHEIHSSLDPIYDTVNQLREQRKTMVQSYEQYAFLYEVLRKMWEENYENGRVSGESQHSKKEWQEPPAKVIKTDVSAVSAPQVGEVN